MGVYLSALVRLQEVNSYMYWHYMVKLCIVLYSYILCVPIQLKGELDCSEWYDRDSLQNWQLY